jgi:transcriptional regulator with XRE-family HTH domain
LQSFGRGFVPPAVAHEIEFRRQQRGLSQRELARLIGRSQGQLANGLRGHDPMSAVSVNRLRDVLLTAPETVTG